MATQINERKGTSMVNTNFMAVSSPTRMRYRSGFVDHAIAGPICGPCVYGARMGLLTLILNVAQGRIVSISRGTPPPKKR